MSMIRINGQYRRAFPSILLPAIALAMLMSVGLARQSLSAAIPAEELPGVQMSEAPWPAEGSYLRARLMAIGLPALLEEGTALHTHQHLDIFVDGKPVSVPAGIGIDADQRFIAPIHTHDATGVIHIESPLVQPFTLGEFFDVWGVRLTAQCLGSYCTRGDTAVRVFSNGQAVTGDPRALALSFHQEIVVTYGTAAALPNPIPSRYTFPAD